MVTIRHLNSIGISLYKMYFFGIIRKLLVYNVNGTSSWFWKDTATESVWSFSFLRFYGYKTFTRLVCDGEVSVWSVKAASSSWLGCQRRSMTRSTAAAYTEWEADVFLNVWNQSGMFTVQKVYIMVEHLRLFTTFRHNKLGRYTPIVCWAFQNKTDKK